MNKEEKLRTLKQNSALHLYYTHLAETLNGAGLDMRLVLKPEIDIPWTPETVKEHLWRPIQKGFLGIESTTDLTTKNIDMVYDVLNRHLGQKFGVSVPFPSEEEILYHIRTKKL